jgi:hypothetical protein
MRFTRGTPTQNASQGAAWLLPATDDESDQKRCSPPCKDPEDSFMANRNEKSPPKRLMTDRSHYAKYD